jgi:dienelactone hydrolase
MYDFAADAQAGIELLRKEPKIDKNKIGIFGHSEGGMIAPYIASGDSGIAFIILMSGPAITGDSIVNYQILASNKQAGLSGELINEALSLQNKIYDEIKKPFLSQKWDSVEAEFIAFTVKSLKALPEDKRQGITDFEQFAKYQMQAQLKAVKTPWFKEFISYKPIETLKKVKCPVLALFGELDFQVPAKPNTEALQNFIEQTGTKNIDMKTFPKANHLFQESVTGMMDEYAILKKEFVPGFSDYIVEWIKKR